MSAPPITQIKFKSKSAKKNSSSIDAGSTASTNSSNSSHNRNHLKPCLKKASQPTPAPNTAAFWNSQTPPGSIASTTHRAKSLKKSKKKKKEKMTSLPFRSTAHTVAGQEWNSGSVAPKRNSIYSSVSINTKSNQSYHTAPAAAAATGGMFESRPQRSYHHNNNNSAAAAARTAAATTQRMPKSALKKKSQLTNPVEEQRRQQRHPTSASDDGNSSTSNSSSSSSSSEEGQEDHPNPNHTNKQHNNYYSTNDQDDDDMNDGSRRSRASRSHTSRNSSNSARLLLMTPRIMHRDDLVRRARFLYKEVATSTTTPSSGQQQQQQLLVINGSGITSFVKLALSPLPKGGLFVTADCRHGYDALLVLLQQIAKHLPEEKGQIKYISQLLVDSANQLATNSNNNSSSSAAPHPSSDSSKTWTRIKLLLRNFLRSLPAALVIFWDNVQEAPDELQRVIEFLCQDEKAHRRLMVFGYKPNEEEDDDEDYDDDEEEEEDMPDWLETIGEQQEISTIVLPRLKKLECMVGDMLGINPEADHIHSLAAVVYERTGGDVCKVKSFLQHCVDRKLFAVRVSSDQYTWVWDLNEIKRQTLPCTPLVRQAMRKLQDKLSPDLLQLLQVAACLGTTFDAGMVESVMFQRVVNDTPPEQQKEPAYKLESKKQFAVLFKQALALKAMEKAPSDKSLEFQFWHPLIREWIYQKTIQQRETLHLEIGFCVFHTLLPQNPWMLRVVCDQLNHGRENIFSESEKKLLVKLNYEASRQCPDDLERKHNYLTNAIALLKTEDERQNKSLTLELHTQLAKTEFLRKQYGPCEESCEVILQQQQQQRSTTASSLPIWQLRLDALEAHRELRRVEELGIQVAREYLGETITAMILSKELAKTQKALNEFNTNYSSIMNLQTAASEVTHTKMGILANLASSSKQHSALVGLRMVQISLKEGMTDHAPYAFAILASVYVTDNRDAAVRYQELALEMLHGQLSNPDQDDELAARRRARVHQNTMMIVYCFLNHWRRPLQQGFEPLRDYAPQSAVVPIAEILFHTGSSLGGVESHIRTNYMSSSEHQQQLLQPLWQFCMNMHGRSNNPSHLHGEVLDYSMYWETIKASSNHVAIHSTLYFRLKLAMYFDLLDIVEEVLGLMDSHAATRTVTGWGSYFYEFEQGLAYLALFRQSKKQKWKQRGQKSLTKLQSWVKEGVSNCFGLYKLLQAEHQTSQNGEDAHKSYQEAIMAFQKERWVQYEARANELAGLYFSKRKEVHGAQQYLTTALQLYEDWGASARVAWFKDKMQRTLRSHQYQQQQQPTRW